MKEMDKVTDCQYQHKDVEVTDVNGNIFYGVEITKYIGGYVKGGTLEIPNRIDGKPVISIGKGAFKDRTDLQCEIILPERILRIGMGAFSNCTGLKGTLVVPSSIKEIKDFAFNNCIGFNKINLTNLNSMVYLGDTSNNGNYTYLDIFGGCVPEQVLVNSNTPVGVLRKLFINNICKDSVRPPRTTFKPKNVVVLDTEFSI